MIDNKKIRAMTLNEMLVVIVLSSIVLGIAFSVLSMVQKHMWAIQKNIGLNAEYTILEQALWIDFSRYSTASYNEFKDQLTLKSENDSINYSFKNNYIIKDRDTLKLSITNKVFYFNGSKTNKGKIDAIKLELDSTQLHKTLFIYKRNDASQFIN